MKNSGWRISLASGRSILKSSWISQLRITEPFSWNGGSRGWSRVLLTAALIGHPGRLLPWRPHMV